MIIRVMFGRCTLMYGQHFYRSRHAFLSKCLLWDVFPSWQKGYPFDRTVLSHLSFKRRCGLWNRDEALCYSQSEVLLLKYDPLSKSWIFRKILLRNILNFVLENKGLFSPTTFSMMKYKKCSPYIWACTVSSLEMKSLFCEYVHIQPGITQKPHNLVSDPETIGRLFLLIESCEADAPYEDKWEHVSFSAYVFVQQSGVCAAEFMGWLQRMECRFTWRRRGPSNSSW